jgi:hypothetical protein
MTTLYGRSHLRSAALWGVVLVVVAALFVLPSSTGVSSMQGSLRVTPGANSYGGQQVVFSGDMGSGQQRIFLQRRGSPSAAWAEVIDPRTGKNFTRLTNRDGSFRFEFPAPAMNFVYFRVHSRKSDTSAHLFKTKHQDADISLIESTPADVPLPRGFAVVTEKFRIAVDTADHDRSGTPTKPILVGRVVTLQVRSGDAWKATGISGTVGRDGRLNFGEDSRGVPGTEVYRVVMEDWTGDGDRVGWFPSVPFYLEVVQRPLPVRGLDADETAAVKLSWALPADPERDKIVIARTVGAGAPQPTAGNPRHVLATIPGGSTSYTDYTVYSSWTFKYAVYTVSDDGIYTELPQRVTVITPDPRRGEG